MSKNEVLTVIKCKFPNLTENEMKILSEFALAVEYRLSQTGGTFSENQCLKSWEVYKSERLPVYNAMRATPSQNYT